MSDIVARIRGRIHDAPMETEQLIDEAADEIERLQRIERVDQALARQLSRSMQLNAELQNRIRELEQPHAKP